MGIQLSFFVIRLLVLLFALSIAGRNTANDIIDTRSDFSFLLFTSSLLDEAKYFSRIISEILIIYESTRKKIITLSVKKMRTAKRFCKK